MWVSVSDRYPDEEIDIEIITIDGQVLADVWYIGKGEFLYGDIVYEDGEVTYWKPKEEQP